MQVDVLGVGCTVFQASDQFEELGVDAVNSQIEGGLLAGFLDRLFNLFGRFGHDFFDAAGMDAAIGQELFQ